MRWSTYVVCMPMNGFSPSARSWTISAALWPFAAQCISFCTVAKNCCERSYVSVYRDRARVVFVTCDARGEIDVG
jgi:hypothetical protein